METQEFLDTVTHLGWNDSDIATHLYCTPCSVASWKSGDLLITGIHRQLLDLHVREYEREETLRRVQEEHKAIFEGEEESLEMIVVALSYEEIVEYLSQDYNVTQIIGEAWRRLPSWPPQSFRDPFLEASTRLCVCSL